MRLAACALLLSATAASAQTLDRRIASAPDGSVHFAYATRSGVCGDGRSFISDPAFGPWGSRTWISQGGGYSGYGPADWRLACQEGPAWVLLSKTGSRISRLEVFVGPELRIMAQGTDLGRLGAAAAAS